MERLTGLVAESCRRLCRNHVQSKHADGSTETLVRAATPAIRDITALMHLYRQRSRSRSKRCDHTTLQVVNTWLRMIVSSRLTSTQSELR